MASLRDLLEHSTYELPPSYDIDGEQRVQLSIAISLRRIADAMWDQYGVGVSENLDRIGEKLTHLPPESDESVGIADILAQKGGR